MRIGMSITSVFACFHPDAMEFYNVCSSLVRMCDKIKGDRSTRLSHDLQCVSLFEPLQPMLAQRYSLHRVGKEIAAQQFCLETKVCVTYHNDFITLE